MFLLSALPQPHSDEPEMKCPRALFNGNRVAILLRLATWHTFLFLLASNVSWAQLPAPGEKAGDLKITPPPFATKMYYEGAQTIGRVGHEAILKRDILHQLKKQAYITFKEQEKEHLPKDADEKARNELKLHILNEFLTNSQIYSSILDGYIKKLLFYNDFVVSRPKEQLEEQTKRLNQTYDRDYLPQLQKQLGITKGEELKEFFTNELQSTMEQDRRLFVYETLAISWLEFNLGEDQYVPTAVELRRYYEANRDRYAKESRVHWQGMTVKFANHPTREAAYNKIAKMGNLVLQETSVEGQGRRFEETARAMSEDFFAARGGDHGWARRGSLSSKEIEEILFSDQLPQGAASRIVESKDGYMILRVIQREEEGWVPFVDVQEEVKKMLLADRRAALTALYEEKLSKRFTIELYNISPEERRARLEASFKNNRSVTGRDVY